MINGQEYTATTTSYQVSSIENDFTYSIKATAEKHKDSLPTETYTFKGKGVTPPGVRERGATVCSKQS